MTDKEQLIGKQRAEFAKAARKQTWIRRVQFIITALSGVAVIVTDSVVAYITALAALLLAILWAWLSWQYRSCRAQAERARRATVLMNALGETISTNELRDLEAHFSVTSDEGERHADPNYYDTSAPPGDERLALILAESAFWSSHLMRFSATRAWRFFVFYLTIGLALVFAAVPLAEATYLQAAIRVFCALLALLVSSDVLGSALAYSTAHRALSNLLPRLDSAKAQGFPRADLLMILSDYNSAVEGAPMFPAGLYEKKKEWLSQLWKGVPPTNQKGEKRI